MKKQVISFVVAAAVGAMALAGCGGGGGAQSANTVDISGRYQLDPATPAWQLDTKEEPTELTWYVNADWWNTEWGNDVVTKQIEKDLNVKITFQTGDDTTLNTMFAGGNKADIVTIFDKNSKVATGAATWAQSLDELAKAYDPYWNEVAVEDTLNWYRLADGQVYGYPNYSNTPADYASGMINGNTAFLVRKDVYEAVGSPAMGTPEEFRAGLEKISAAYPDLTPFGFNSIGTGTGSLSDVFQDFLGVPIETESGEWYNRNLDPGYLTWMDTLREVHNDGNISDDSFADDSTTFEEKVKSGRYATMLVAGLAQQGGNLQSWMSTNPDAQYIAIDGPQSTVGQEPKLNQSDISGWMINYISKTAAEPAKAMQLFTYLQSEYGQMLTTYGIEGETYEYDADGKIVLLPEVLAVKNDNPDQFKKEYRLGEFMFFGHDRYLALQADSMKTPALLQPQAWGSDKLFPHFVIENIDPVSGTAEARSLTTLNTDWNTTMVSLIRASSKSDFDLLISTYESNLASNGMDAVAAVRTENMAKNREILGLNEGSQSK